MNEPAKDISKELSEAEQGEADQRAAISATVIHEAIRKQGEAELSRPSSALAWSGLAAGLSMGFSLVGEGVIRSHLPDAPWMPLLSKFGYSLGFLIVILGRQQLFTENTLTAIIPLLTSRRLDCLLNVLRLWVIVLVSNLAGVFLFAWVAGSSDVFSPEARNAFAEIGISSMKAAFGTVLLKGIFSGWLIALMVWMLPAADTARVAIIVIITYVVGIFELSHIIAGSAETLYLVSVGRISFGNYLGHYMVPVLIGNIIGGVALTAALNHAQVIAGKGEKRQKPAL